MITKENLIATLNQHGIPERMHEGFRHYLFDHTPTGDFLTAVFCNDFVEVLKRTDEDNRKLLSNYAALLYNELPSHRAAKSPWGSPAAVKAWIENKDGEFEL
jgi:hypothetical protein